MAVPASAECYTTFQPEPGSFRRHNITLISADSSDRRPFAQATPHRLPSASTRHRISAYSLQITRAAFYGSKSNEPARQLFTLTVCQLPSSLAVRREHDVAGDRLDFGRLLRPSKAKPPRSDRESQCRAYITRCCISLTRTM